MTEVEWTIGQEVKVASRTWPGINKPGGHGKIVKIHYSSLGVVDSLDVKYTLGNNTDTNLETDLVEPHIELDRGRRSRRSRDFIQVGDNGPKVKNKAAKKQVAETPKTDEDNEEEKNDEEKCCDKENVVEAKRPAAAKKKPAPKEKRRKKPYPEGARPTAGKKKKQHLKVSTAAIHSNKQDKCTGRKSVDTTASADKTDVPMYIVTRGLEGPISPLMAGTTPQNAAAAQDVSSRSVSDEEYQAIGPDTTVRTNALKNVYNGYVQEANTYITSLVGPPKKQAAKTFAPPPAKTAEEIAEDERCQELGKRFNSVMLQFDMAIPEDDLLDEINAGGSTFTLEEVERFVSRLCDQEKIMKSDGCIYSI